MTEFLCVNPHGDLELWWDCGSYWAVVVDYRPGKPEYYSMATAFVETPERLGREPIDYWESK